MLKKRKMIESRFQYSSHHAITKCLLDFSPSNTNILRQRMFYGRPYWNKEGVLSHGLPPSRKWAYVMFLSDPAHPRQISSMLLNVVRNHTKRLATSTVCLFWTIYFHSLSIAIKTSPPSPQRTFQSVWRV